MHEFPIVRLRFHNAAHLRETLELIVPPGTPVFLHYVGYGYQKRGCPRWLAQGLERWRRNGKERRLAVMFHELFAFGPVWTSSFWLSFLQRRITARVARLADTCVTNMSMYANRLGRFAPRHAGKVTVMPVFSTMGEPADLRPSRQRQPWLVLFGGGAWTTDAVAKHAAKLDQACAALSCDRIIAIGAPGRIAWSGHAAFEETGILPAAEVSTILGQARAGFLGYFPGYLGKSTIFAAYCAHGLLPIFPEPNPSELDGVMHRIHYLTLDDLIEDCPLETIDSVVANSRQWYQRHDLAKAAGTVAQILPAP